jgi:hypothetical protein
VRALTCPWLKTFARTLLLLVAVDFRQKLVGAALDAVISGEVVVHVLLQSILNEKEMNEHRVFYEKVGNFGKSCF